jgi:hypothetical protein
MNRTWRDLNDKATVLPTGNQQRAEAIALQEVGFLQRSRKHACRVSVVFRWSL